MKHSRPSSLVVAALSLAVDAGHAAGERAALASSNDAVTGSCVGPGTP